MVLGVGHGFVGRELLWGPEQLAIMITPSVASALGVTDLIHSTSLIIGR